MISWEMNEKIYGQINIKVFEELYEEPYALIGHVRFCEGQVDFPHL